MSRNFLVFFHGKEGSTAMLDTLARFDAIDLVHVGREPVSEPFDAHTCGPMRGRDYERCLRLVFDGRKDVLEELNRLYGRTARLGPIAPFDKSRSVGFKMRLSPQRPARLAWRARAHRRRHVDRTLDVLAEHDVVAFVTVRRDLLRLALSRYHGDGSGRRGHLQFALADGHLTREEIPRIVVDCDALAEQIEAMERRIRNKEKLVARLEARGIPVHWLDYEVFRRNKRYFFRQMLEALDIHPTPEELEAALAKGSRFKKVHSDDIRDFVANHDEVLERFGHLARAGNPL